MAGLPPKTESSERLAVIETKLDAIQTTLNLELRHMRESADKDRLHTAQRFTEVEAELNKKANHAENERLWSGQSKVNWFIGSTSIGAMITLIFALIDRLT